MLPILSSSYELVGKILTFIFLFPSPTHVQPSDALALDMFDDMEGGGGGGVGGSGGRGGGDIHERKRARERN